MQIKQSEFIISAAAKHQYVEGDLPEVAFVGRSNVGKSSIINAITNRRHLAKTSSTPGKTRLVNFFLINKDQFYIVDLPGYGYAKVSKTERQSWGKSIEQYLVGRTQLKKVILLVDCRHDPSSDDLLMLDWIRHYGYRIIVVATKADKLNRNELNKSLKNLKVKLDLREDEILTTYSSLKKTGTEELLNLLFDDIVQI
jgi:GTP-binding protein